MSYRCDHDQARCSRHQFLCRSVLFAGTTWIGTAISMKAFASAAKPGRLAFRASDQEFICDTGQLKGKLRSGGRSLGLTPLVHGPSATPIAGRYGLVSHYRLLDSQHRFGTAGWDWASTATLLSNGSVRVTWKADKLHPFDMNAEYRWSTPATIDVTTGITAHQDLQRFEVFLASYFNGFAESRVYVQTGKRAGMMEATKARGAWQMYPRDAAAVAMIQDGRWQRPPHPVAWKIMPRLAGPLALRRDASSGLVGMLMAPRDDCFAISTPYGADSHRSIYLSLFGRDIPKGQHAVARARLVIGRRTTDHDAIALYRDYERTM